MGNAFIEFLRRVPRFTALVLCACALSCSKEEPLRIAWSPWPGWGCIPLAEELGFFDEEGVDVEIAEFATLFDSRRSFERGQVDGFTGTCAEVLIAGDNSNRVPQSVLVTDYSDGADVLVGRASLGGVRGLAGQHIAIEPATLGVYALARALESAELTLDDVTMVPMDGTSMVEAMFSGTCVAAVTYPPFSAMMLADSTITSFWDSRSAPREIVGLLSFDQSVLEEREDDVRAVFRAFYKARKFVEENPEEGYRLLAARERMSVEDFHAALTGIRIVTVEEQPEYFGPNGVLASGFSKADAALRKVGQLSGPNHTDQAFRTLAVQTAQVR